MTQIELNEIAKIPDKYRPIGAWSYFFLTILFAIPLIGQICLIVFALSDSNINRRSFARSFFCTFIIIAVLLVIILVTVGGAAGAAGIFG